jgi:hypothetical protein
MADTIDAAGAGRRLPPMALGWRPESHSWNMRSWSGLMAGQTLAHIPNREQLLLSGISQRLTYTNQLRDDSVSQWAVLRTMAGPGRPTSDVELVALRSALQHAIDDQNALVFSSNQLATLVVQSRMLTKAEVDQAWREGIEDGRTSRTCEPLQSPPPGSRQSIHQWLDLSPVKPGEGVLDTLGVAGAASTER